MCLYIEHFILHCSAVLEYENFYGLFIDKSLFDA